ncbi:cytochrome c [Granulosicoccus antarcticus]|uniref:Nicotinate dehydrogenase subunit B n=1 Tax=Granulosicoccus antarcticus IMCC3135 TaxID=1192854 RepID=A0A2Z2P2K4_9GAMM|nr:cytochrome c [Granulosicoccus antarcticus]ASJ73924.1 Nicotinate dehydrogenase subunit B [Granulosicoccus antarcticus IMCC3135]
MLKTFLVTLTSLVVLSLGGFAVYAYHSEIAPIQASESQQFDPATVEKGRILAAAGYCASCHTAGDGEPYTGNYAMDTGFGILYSTNITPDVEQGIGSWSQEAFLRAMHEGVDREGKHLFPAFPYDHFAKMSEEDINAIYAYIMSEIKPAKAIQKENELPFPLDQRILQAGWKMLFVDFDRYEPDTDKSEEWNRGAYLVEGVTHCGACHTPRNLLGAEQSDQQYAGANVDRWTAPALTADNPSAIQWSAADFSEYLQVGSTRYQGSAAGPMAPVVHAGLRELPESDLDAIGVYLAELSGSTSTAQDNASIVAASLALGKPSKAYRENQGERLYASACASCHYNVEQIALGRPDLGINSSTRLDDPDNLIHVILDGVSNDEGMAGVVMPGFRGALNDDEIASIAAYLRSSRTDKSAWTDLPAKISNIRTH